MICTDIFFLLVELFIIFVYLLYFVWVGKKNSRYLYIYLKDVKLIYRYMISIITHQSFSLFVVHIFYKKCCNAIFFFNTKYFVKLYLFQSFIFYVFDVSEAPFYKNHLKKKSCTTKLNLHRPARPPHYFSYVEGFPFRMML